MFVAVTALFSQTSSISQIGRRDAGFRGFGGQGMVLSPQQTINHTPPPSQHVQHLQPTHTPLPIEVGTLQTTSTPQGSQYRYNLHPEEERPTSGERPSEQEERAVPTQFAPAGTAPSRSKLSLFLFLFAKHPRYAVTAGAYRHSYFLPSG